MKYVLSHTQHRNYARMSESGCCGRVCLCVLLVSMITTVQHLMAFVRAIHGDNLSGAPRLTTDTHTQMQETHKQQQLQNKKTFVHTKPQINICSCFLRCVEKREIRKMCASV